ncbi:MAG: DNA polymerase III subunit epsilon [Proteobacteria bacterium]|jgi:DNA polymerase III subunit epsilon|nr:DNA polymerase III subunit epsilon [Pseudomonadota bacterium]MDA0872305.1 DNA polymerase III subunit epsilon [Pseudomonadota bacterium]
MAKQIFLDTETTGLDPKQGHRIIEIAAIEFNNRQPTNRRFHSYINPERDIDPAAEEVHGLSIDFLQDKPLFKDVVNDFLAFVQNSEVVIHNAPFDVGFINAELGRLGLDKFEENTITITDSLKFAKEIRPGQRNSLDALCKAFDIDNSSRTLHGALLDAQLLGEVFIGMTRGQEAISIDFVEDDNHQVFKKVDLSKLQVIQLLPEDIDNHTAYIRKHDLTDW